MVKTVGIDKEIKITDKLNFVLETRDSKECLRTPYQILNATIYFVSREFTDTSVSEYSKDVLSKSLVEKYEKVKKEICLKSKSNVRVATTSNISLSGIQTIDGIETEEDDRVLVRSQNNPAENGIYSIKNNAWVRSEDVSLSSDLVSGMYVFVDEGIENIGSGWVLQSDSEFILETTPLVFVKFSDNGIPASPTHDSVSLLNSLKFQIEQSKFSSNFFYKDAVAVKTFGGLEDKDTREVYPAWLNPDMVPSELRSKVMSDNILSQFEEEGEIVDGKFILNWNPAGCREGDYFLCWSWMPNLAGDVLSAHIQFGMEGDGSLTASIPTHVTKPEKYEILLDRYLPEMFKTSMADNDISPLVLKGLNNSVAAGFTFLENMANQIIDLLDANATHEQFLPLLSNFFNLRLKSDDPTLWRRQIKKAVPNFKKKGSIVGLREALGDIGMKFLKITRLWQIVSKYTHQEHFDFDGSSVFDLSKTAILPADSNFAAWIRRSGESEWSVSNDVQWSVNKVTWSGSPLQQGDSIRVSYKTRAIHSSFEQDKENYTKSLPLMDDRDERSQDYPPKNWNVRLIEEDDPMFDILVPVRHPFTDPFVWGRIRTEFPYSENAYNMDEYNGSKRDSFIPCDIDKEFMDSCGNCQSSKFILDVEAEMLDDESFNEARQITEEYMPFHSVAHKFNLSGGTNEFIGPATERIETLLTYSGEEYTLAGEGQNIFNRNMDREQIQNVKRDILSDFSMAREGSGTIKNEKIVLFSSAPNSASYLSSGNKGTTQSFDAKNINTSVTDQNVFDNSNLVEVLNSNVLYATLSDMDNEKAIVAGSVDAEMIGPTFEYRVSNKIDELSVNITQADQIIFNDVDADFSILGITTQKDVDAEVSEGPVWRLRHSGSLYSVQDVLPDGTLLLKYDSAGSQVSGWELLRNNVVMKDSLSGSGFVSVMRYGLVEVVSPTEHGVQIGDYLYLNFNSEVKMYRVKSFSKTDFNKFYIENYEEGSSNGEDAIVYRRILDKKVGRFGYDGIILNAEDNLEGVLPVSNGASNESQAISSEDIKENYLILIGGEKYYSISDIEGTRVVLSGFNGEWGLSGETVDFSIYKFEKQGLDVPESRFPPVPGHSFETIDRSGGVILSNSGTTSMGVMAESLNCANSGSVDFLSQNESIDFKVEYKE